jgi:hypothetical protein
MTQDTEKTIVIFRKFKDGNKEVIALFPEIIADPTPEFCESYMHVGQHGGAMADLTDITRPATPEEYAELKAELEDIGYNLTVKKKNQYKYYLTRLQELRRIG